MANANRAGTRALTVNGEPVTDDAATLDALIERLGYAGKKIATAVNGEFVAARARAEIHLADGDQVEIVAPRQGG